MTSETAKTASGFIRVSILIKCLLILSAATLSVAGLLTYNADKMSEEISQNGMQILARDVTHLTAVGLEGAVRFGKTENVLSTIQTLMDGHLSKISSILVVNAGSEIIAQIGTPVGPDLATLATTSMLTATSETTGDSLWVAVPIGVTEEGIATGALAIAWTDAPALAELHAAQWRNHATAAGVFLLVLGAAGAFFRYSLAAPLARVAKRTADMSKGDLTNEIAGQGRRDEIGLLSRELEQLRAQLHAAESVTQDALFKSAGFQGSSTALTMTDIDLELTHFNAAFEDFLATTAPAMFNEGANCANDLIGKPLTQSVRDHQAISAMVSKGTFPVFRDLRVGQQIIALKINQVLSINSAPIGYIFEWADITLSGTNNAIIAALEADQMRADFDSSAKLKNLNARMIDVFPNVLSAAMPISIDDFIAPTSKDVSLKGAATGHSIFDKFELRHNQSSCIVSGSVTPILDRDGQTTGYVFLGTDITAAENINRDALQATAALEKAQKLVVDTLSAALTALSQGDLTIRLETPFDADYETLRSHFNESVRALDEAVSLVLDNSSSILGEAGNISGAADDLSRRTEQQAATLEEFAAALTQITASVASAADGANKASNVVTDARKNAEASGTVVREAVDAMGEIANSSEQISRIISVIDDIAFQTNLLALNAGVEAARAGDAGRGFAVVASEVRALAQRSSEAAREINTLISTSGNQVKRGVSLVDKAGDALTEIVSSVGYIEEHVTGIAASAREQSTGLEEINTAISQLDQVTQQNVAMFEETTAATHTLTAEANALVSTTTRFRTSGAKSVTAQQSPQQHATPPSIEDRLKSSPSTSSAQTSQKFTAPTTPRRASGISDGALAIADDDNWEDF